MTKNYLRLLTREMLREERQRRDLELHEGKVRDVMNWVRVQGSAGVNSLKDFFRRLKVERGETKEGAAILMKMVRREELSKEETDALKQQIKDLGKGIPLLALVTLPGGALATVGLVKLASKFNIDLMPSVWSETR